MSAALLFSRNHEDRCVPACFVCFAVAVASGGLTLWRMCWNFLPPPSPFFFLFPSCQPQRVFLSRGLHKQLGISLRTTHASTER